LFAPRDPTRADAPVSTVAVYLVAYTILQCTPGGSPRSAAGNGDPTSLTVTVGAEPEIASALLPKVTVSPEQKATSSQASRHRVRLRVVGADRAAVAGMAGQGSGVARSRTACVCRATCSCCTAGSAGRTCRRSCGLDPGGPAGAGCVAGQRPACTNYCWRN